MFIPVLAQQTAVSNNTVDTSSYQYVTFSADTMTTDTITIVQVLPNGGTAPAVNVNGTTVAAFTSAIKTATFFGGIPYLCTKVGTTDNAGLYMAPAGKSV